MDASGIETRIAELAEPVLTSLGLSLWGVEAQMGGKGQTLRVFVESAEPGAEDSPDPRGVGVDKLAQASRHLSLLLDVDDFIPGPYRLEVSSPGFERLFFKPEQMAAYVGRKVEIKTHEALDGRKKFRGNLVAVEGATLTIHLDDAEVVLEWNEIRRAKLVVDDPWAETKARKK